MKYPNQISIETKGYGSIDIASRWMRIFSYHFFKIAVKKVSPRKECVLIMYFISFDGEPNMVGSMINITILQDKKEYTIPSVTITLNISI
jgi:hypothetical protein